MKQSKQIAALKGRLFNWKFSQATTALKECPKEVQEQCGDVIHALDRLLGDCGWFGGDLGLIVSEALVPVMKLLGGNNEL